MIPTPRAALLSRKMTAAEALTCLAQHCAQDFVRALPLMMKTDDPEGTHKTRVALRRLRSVLDGFRPIIGKQALSALKTEAKTLFRTIGTLRDAEIAALTLADNAALPVVRASTRAEMTALDAPGFARRVGALMQTRDWHRQGRLAKGWRQGPVAALAQLALEVAWSTCLSYGQDLATLAPDIRHALRKDLKTLRYLCEFFAPLWPGRDAKPFFATMEALQGQLGILTDIAAMRLLRRTDAATLAVQDRQSAAALTEADRLWRALVVLGVWWR